MNKFSLFLCTFALATTFVAKSQTVQPVQSDIFYEIAHGNKKSIKTWLASNPDLSIRNPEGQSVLAYAALTGQRDLVKMFIKPEAVAVSGVMFKVGAVAVPSATEGEAWVNAVDNAGKTALDHAVEFGHVKIIYDLVKQGGKVTTSDNLYHLKSVMKDRGFSLFLRFIAISLFSGFILMPIFYGIFLVSGLFNIVMLPVMGGLFVINEIYLWSLPFRAYSWNKASNKNWMLSTGTISLN